MPATQSCADMDKREPKSDAAFIEHGLFNIVPQGPVQVLRLTRGQAESAEGRATIGSSLLLVGMMGTGKSSVGKKLAASLGYSFFDTCVPRRRCPASVRPGPALSKNTSPTVERHRPSVARP